MRIVRLGGIFVASLSCWTLTASADSIYTASLTASQNLNPVTNTPSSSSAGGKFTLNYNATTNVWSYTISFSNLTSPTTTGNIQLGAPGASGPVLFTLYDHGSPPSPATNGETIAGTLTPANFVPQQIVGVTSFADAISDIQSGSTYVNVRSVNHPEGEIRGQISAAAAGAAAPEPATSVLALLGIGLGIFGLVRRKRSR